MQHTLNVNVFEKHCDMFYFSGMDESTNQREDSPEKPVSEMASPKEGEKTHVQERYAAYTACMQHTLNEVPGNICGIRSMYAAT
jgi:hypothetical protein